MSTSHLAMKALTKLTLLIIESICILLVFHLVLVRNTQFLSIFNNGYGIFHGWACGNIAGDVTFTLSVFAGLCLYIPSTIFCVIDYYLEKHNLLHKYKVTIPNTSENICIAWDKYLIAINLATKNAILSMFIIPCVVFPIMEFRGNCDRFTMFSHHATPVNYVDIFWYLAKVLCMSVGYDILFYCSHRTLHEIKWCYQYIHKVHHNFHNTFGIAASAAHPLEHIFGNLFTVFGTPIILKMNCLSVFIFTCIAAIGTTWGHSGYDNPSNPFVYSFRKFMGNPHDYHHLYINCEYGSGYNGLMDTIFKTRIQDIYPKRWTQIVQTLQKALHK